QLGIAPRTTVVDIDDTQLIDWMVSYNLKRRHLTTTQRAAVAAKIANLKQGGVQSANLPDAKSQAAAAKQMHVSSRSVGSAVRIAKASPELHAAMLRDDISTHAAEQIVKLPAEEREAATANAVRRRPPGEKKAHAAVRCASARPQLSPPKHRNRSFHAVYGSLLSELDDLPKHLATHPLNSDQRRDIIEALNVALAVVGSTENEAPEHPDTRSAVLQPVDDHDQ
ncbi:MAG: hypothetical protein ABL897_03390, partial [Hyphomicrobium sp.]